MPEGIAGAIIAAEGPTAQPEWVVEPNTGPVQLPQMVPVVVQALLTSYQTMMRATLLAQAARLEALGGPGAVAVPLGDARGDVVIDAGAAVRATPAP